MHHCAMFVALTGHCARRSIWGRKSETSQTSQTILALGRKHMAHNHGSEYQVRIVHGDGTEELSEWLNSAEQVAQAIAADHKPQGKAYWIRARSVLCTGCPDREQTIVECRITDIPSPRYSPHDSRYLVEVGSKSRYELEVAIWDRHRAA
jgi:hypothetical protein